MGKPDYPDDYCSTSSLARLLGIPGHSLFDLFREGGLVDKNDQGWDLTALGAAAGGRTGSLGGPASFPIWPRTWADQRNLDEVLRRDLRPFRTLPVRGNGSGTPDPPSVRTHYQLAAMLRTHFSGVVANGRAGANLKSRIVASLTDFAAANGLRLLTDYRVECSTRHAAGKGMHQIPHALLEREGLVGAILIETGNRRRSIAKLNDQVACGVPSLWVKCGGPPRWWPRSEVKVIWVRHDSVRLVSEDDFAAPAQREYAVDSLQTETRLSQSAGSDMPELTALEVLELLADGYDPRTGERLPSGSPCHSPLTIRALFHAIRALEAAEKDQPQDCGDGPPARASRRLPANAGQAWTEEEEERLTQKFKEGQSIRSLAEAHGRTPGAIKSRLQRLRLIE